MQGGVKRPPLLCKSSIDVIDGAQIIPVELGGCLAPPTLPINELGRRLLRASVDGQVEEIKWLMNKGAPFTADWLGTSPLHFAAQNNYLDVCELLLRAGISKDARTKVDRTPLHMAASEGHIEIIKCLLRYNADIECRDLLEMTPLHWAVQNGHAEIVSFLVSKGAQIQVVNKFGLTPMEISIQCERYDILGILKSCVRDPMIAAQNLTIELNEMDNSNECYTQNELVETLQNSPSYLETINLEDSDNEGAVEYSDPLDETTEDEDQSDCINKEQNFQLETKELTEDNKLTESLRLLQQHGITMLPADDSNILSSVLELGRSVVLTDVGKEVLNSTKPIDPVVISQPKKLPTLPIKQKIVTVTPEEFMAMATNQNKFKHLNGNLSAAQKQRPPVKRIIMKKNKVMPFSNNKVTKIFTSKHDNIMDVKMLIEQLADAKSLAEEYQQKYLNKCEEAEQYKQQIVMLTRNKS